MRVQERDIVRVMVRYVRENIRSVIVLRFMNGQEVHAYIITHIHVQVGIVRLVLE